MRTKKDNLHIILPVFDL